MKKRIDKRRTAVRNTDLAIHLNVSLLIHPKMNRAVTTRMTIKISIESTNFEAIWPEKSVSTSNRVEVCLHLDAAAYIAADTDTINRTIDLLHRSSAPPFHNRSIVASSVARWFPELRGRFSAVWLPGWPRGCRIQSLSLRFRFGLLSDRFTRSLPRPAGGNSLLPRDCQLPA